MLHAVGRRVYMAADGVVAGLPWLQGDGGAEGVVHDGAGRARDSNVRSDACSNPDACPHAPSPGPNGTDDMNGLDMLKKPSRLRFMDGLSAAQDATAISDALVKANLRRLYPEGIELPEGEKTNIGGDVTFPIVMPPAPRPNGLATALGAAALTLLVVGLLATIGAVWWWRSPLPAPLPIPPVSTSEQYQVSFFNP